MLYTQGMFKKYIFLLILSFFSIQSFAAGCPDGSEPVKSISADSKTAKQQNSKKQTL